MYLNKQKLGFFFSFSLCLALGWVRGAMFVEWMKEWIRCDISQGRHLKIILWGADLASFHWQSLGRDPGGTFATAKVELDLEGPRGGAGRPPQREAATRDTGGPRAGAKTKVSKFSLQTCSPLRSGIKCEHLLPPRASKTAAPSPALLPTKRGHRAASGKCHPPPSASSSCCHLPLPKPGPAGLGLLEQSETQGQVAPQQSHQRRSRRRRCHEACAKPSK